MPDLNRREFLGRSAVMTLLAALPPSLVAQILSKPAPVSDFGASSTAEEVTEGLDLTGKTYAITGCNSGLFVREAGRDHRGGFFVVHIDCTVGDDITWTIEQSTNAIEHRHGGRVPPGAEELDPWISAWVRGTGANSLEWQKTLSTGAPSGSRTAPAASIT